MFLIQEFNINNTTATNSINPLWARNYEGFELEPETGRERISVCSGNDNYQLNTTSNQWEVVTDQIFYTPAQIRNNIQYWNAANPLGFKFQSAYNGVYKIGYWYVGDTLLYAMDYALANHLGITYTLVRNLGSTTFIDIPDPPPSLNVGCAFPFFPAPTLQPTAQTSSVIAFPKNLSRERITNVWVKSKKETVQGTITADGIVSQGLTSPAIRLEVEITPKIDTTGETPDLYQIAELPSIILQLITPNMQYYVDSQSTVSVRISDTEWRTSTIAYQVDQVIEVAVLVDLLHDARIIATTAIAHLNQNSRIFLPPLNDYIYVRPKGKVRYNEGLAASRGYFASCTFDIEIPRLPEATHSEVVDRIVD